MVSKDLAGPCKEKDFTPNVIVILFVILLKNYYSRRLKPGYNGHCAVGRPRPFHGLDSDPMIKCNGSGGLHKQKEIQIPFFLPFIFFQLYRLILLFEYY